MDIELKQSLIDIRRDLHRHPEAGWMEFRTTMRIIKELQQCGISVTFGKKLHCAEKMFGLPNDDILEEAWNHALSETSQVDLMTAMHGGYTGCMAEIQGAFPGKLTVFRIDIDACELKECQDFSHIPAREGFASLEDGVMHACGHDAHAAIGIGAAILLQQHRDQLRGTVRILFQPAEEGLRGAASMTAAGLLSGCDRLIGLHVGLHDLPLGTVAASCTDFLSSTKMDVSFRGKAAHAGICPELGKNALAAAAKATLDLLDLPTQFDGLCRVNVGTLHAGTGRNVIPANAHMAIETRSDCADTNRLLQSASERVCAAAAASYGCAMETTYMGGSNAAECDAEFAQEVIQILSQMPQIKSILPSIPFGGGEDVTTMMQFVQEHGGWATELLIGMPLRAPHHSERFDIDEGVIPLGAEMLLQLGLALG